MCGIVTISLTIAWTQLTDDNFHKQRRVRIFPTDTKHIAKIKYKITKTTKRAYTKNTETFTKTSSHQNQKHQNENNVNIHLHYFYLFVTYKPMSVYEYMLSLRVFAIIAGFVGIVVAIITVKLPVEDKRRKDFAIATQVIGFSALGMVLISFSKDIKDYLYQHFQMTNLKQ